MKIHGNYCGPDWTAGRKVAARDYLLGGGDFSVKPTDWLDRLCLRHDKGCASSELGCSKADDQRLLNGISKWYSNPLNPLFHPIMNVKAQAVRTGIELAQGFRSR